MLRGELNSSLCHWRKTDKGGQKSLTWEEEGMGGRAVDHDPGYTALCSRLTLYSDKEGFFRELASSVMAEVAQRTAAATTLGIGQSFAALRSEEHRVQYVAALEGVAELEPPALSRSKAAKEAQARREEGNSALKLGDARKALVLYSASVMRAPEVGADMTVDNGLTLPYALANRSAALLQLNRPDLSSRDAKMALTCGYPEEKSHVLLERIGKCEEATGRWSAAKAVYEDALKGLAKKERAGELGTRLQKAIQKCSSKEKDSCGKKKGKVNNKARQQVATELPPLTGGHSALLPNAAKSVGVAEVKSQADETADGPVVGVGRFAVAVSDISAGDTLVAEPAFASVLLPEKAGTHCHHCFARLYAPLPCPRCSGVAFCGSECRDAAESSYHPFECPIGSTLIASGLSMLSRLALRMLTKAPLDQQVEALEDYHYDPQTNKLWTKEDAPAENDRSVSPLDMKENDPGNMSGGRRRYYDASDYQAIMNLITLEEERSPVDMLERALMAVFLIKCLRQTTFFKKVVNKDMEETIGFRSEEELFAARLLLHYLQMLQFNAHEIFETIYEREFCFKASKTQYLGVAIYPTVALFNHDCYPATMRYFVGTSIVIRALRPLKAGEVIPENYGPVFTKQSLRERQRILRSRYWFICQCEACLGDWPTYKAMEEDLPIRLRCTKVGCQNIIPVEAGALEEREHILRPKKVEENKVTSEITELVDEGEGNAKNKRKKKSRKAKGNKCESCSSSIINQMDKVVRLQATFEEGLSAMERAGDEGSSADVERANKLFCKSIDGWSDCIIPPYRQHVLAQDSLRLCITNYGNIYIPEAETATKAKV